MLLMLVYTLHTISFGVLILERNARGARGARGATTRTRRNDRALRHSKDKHINVERHACNLINYPLLPRNARHRTRNGRARRLLCFSKRIRPPNYVFGI